jgi:Raf kinase inhibitor-like YbhB/YbcL family protein
MVSGLPLPVALSFLLPVLMRLTSLAFADKLPVPSQYTCNGQNVSPPLEFIDVPKGTVSLALIVEDVDSSDSWVHWLVYNIPGEVSHFDEGQLPEGAVDGICSNGKHGYQGPCPKYFQGVHRYRFSLFALDTPLDLPLTAAAHDVNQVMAGHVLESAELIGIAEGEMI